MTLDEAIKHCKEKTEHLRDGVRTCKSMTVAEQADCLECANEHEQLAEWLEDYKRLLGEKSYAMGYQDGLEDGLMDMRPQGKWIDEDNGCFNFKKCSVCNEAAEWLDGGSQLLSNFCSNCGARMKGGEEMQKVGGDPL